MKQLRFVMVMAVLAATVLSGAALYADQGDKKSQDKETPNETGAEIRWVAFDEGLALLEADTTNKHMFIDMTASWCGWCKRMEKEAFADTAIIAMVNKYFIPVKVWGDSNRDLDIDGYKISEKNLARAEFKVRGYPEFWFLSPTRSRIGPLSGYQTAEKLSKALTWVKDFQYDTTRTSPPKTNDEPNK